jgi:hypothetical protein
MISDNVATFFSEDIYQALVHSVRKARIFLTQNYEHLQLGNGIDTNVV